MAYNPKQALSMKGFPFIFKDVNWKESLIHSRAIFIRFLNNLKNGESYFIYNDNGEVVSYLFDELDYKLADLQAIDFIWWVNKNFKDKDLPPTSKILYIYNVGMEIGKTGFSDILLNNIIINNSNNNNITIVASNEITFTVFKREYPKSAKHIKIGRQILRQN